MKYTDALFSFQWNESTEKRWQNTAKKKSVCTEMAFEMESNVHVEMC